MRRRKFIQKTIFVFSVLGLNPLFMFSRLRFKVADFEENWKDYIETPCDKTAIQAYNTIPLYDMYDKQKKSRIVNQIDIDLEKLETHLLTGNKNALDLSFKLFSITDGALSSSMHMIIGPYMHIDPTYFLESLDRHYHLVAITKVLGNYGIDLVDEFELQNIETQKRIDSLNLVVSPKFQKLKKECIGHVQNNYYSKDLVA